MSAGIPAASCLAAVIKPIGRPPWAMGVYGLSTICGMLAGRD
jgi:hypothetical protein